MNREHHAQTKARRVGGLGGRRGFKMPPRHEACGKRRCRSQADAVTYALWLARRTTTPLRVYRCDGPGGCGGWHVTKRPTWEDPR